MVIATPPENDDSFPVYVSAPCTWRTSGCVSPPDGARRLDVEDDLAEMQVLAHARKRLVGVGQRKA